MRLPYVLDERDFSVAELTAARLDGVLVGYGDAFCTVDSLDDEEFRAASLMSAYGPERAVARITAAWVWGVLPFLARPRGRGGRRPIEGRRTGAGHGHA